MRTWKVKTPGGRTFMLESDNPGADLIAKGHTAFALEEIFPTPPAWKELPTVPDGENSVPDVVLTVPEAAKLLKVCDKTVYTWTHRADFPAVKIGNTTRIPYDLLLAWVEAQATRKES